MRHCLIDATTKVCVNIVELKDENEFIPHNNLILAPNHDGEIGWVWNGNDWTDPNAVVFTDQEKAAIVRRQRQTVFQRTVDKINPLMWQSFTQEQKNAWSQYRQALLDITNQEGFPDNVVWPQVPQG